MQVYRPSNDLFAVIVLTILAVMSTLLGLSNTLLRTILAVPLVFVLPGYALMSALFPRRESGLTERLLFTLCLSMIIAILGAFLLHASPWGLRPSTWTLLLGGMTLSLSAVALARANGLSSTVADQRGVHLAVRSWVLLGLAILVAATAVGIARHGAVQQSTPGLTQFWILPGGQDEPNAIRLGLQNHEPMTTRYRVELRAGDMMLREWPSQEIAPGQSWETTFTLPAGASKDVPLEAVLYRLGVDETAYRRVRLAPVELRLPE